MIKILVVEDQNIFRKALVNLISGYSNFSVVGEASNGKEAVDFIIKFPDTDIVLMDYRMPEMNGLLATEAIGDLNSKVKVLMLTMYADEDFMKEALIAGAMSILTKNDQIDEIVTAIEQVHKGNYYLPSHGIELLVKKLKQYADTGIDEKTYTPTEKADDLLTKREQEILQLLIDGKTSQEIADEMRVSRRTIEINKNNMLLKTKSKNIIGLAAFAISDGLIKALNNKNPKDIQEGKDSLK